MTAAEALPLAASVQALAHQRFVQLFVQQAQRSHLALIFINFVLAFLWSLDTGDVWPWAWWLAATAFGMFRHLSTERLVLLGNAEQSTQRIRQLMLGSGLVQTLPLLAFAALSLATQSVLTLVLVTLSTVSVVTTSGFQRVFMAFAAPMLWGLVAAWGVASWFDQSWPQVGICAMLGVYLWFLRVIGQHAHAVFLEACAWRFGEQQLNGELTRALANADTANRSKTRFLAAASHDLRQPIHSMSVLVAALKLRTLDGPTSEIVGHLNSVNQMLSRQLDALLDVSKLDAGVVQADMRLHRLDHLVQSLQSTVVPVAASKGLSLELHAQHPIWVRTDATLLARVISNLTDNALKFTPSSGKVRIGARLDGEWAVLEVKDTGIGISPEDQARVFDEFYQAHNDERDRAQGLGLGLSIVRRLCHLLGVQLQLRSALGAGTSVELRLPRQAAPSGAHVTEDSSASTLGGLSVLVVDDEPLVRESMRLLLQELGCTVCTADGVSSAAHEAQLHRLDLLLCDFRLRDGITGIDAIQAVRAIQPDLAAVLISGDTAPERIREAQRAGVPLLFKPVALGDLMAVMAQPGRPELVQARPGAQWAGSTDSFSND